MAKNSVPDWDTTAANNTDIGGIDIDEGCAPSGINNAMRELMAQIRAGVPVKVSSTTDNAIARFDGTTGQLQNSQITISDVGTLTINGTTAALIDFYEADAAKHWYVVGDAGTFAIRETSLAGTSVISFAAGGAASFAVSVDTPVLKIGGATLSAATSAQMEAGSSNTVFVTPSNFYKSPFAAKAYVYFNTAGSILAASGVTSVTDNGTGNFTVNWSTAFSSTSYVVIPSVYHTGGFLGAVVNSLSTTSAQILIRNSAGTLTDPTNGVMVVAYGDQ